MKKILALIIVTLLLCCLCVSCGNKTENGGSDIVNNTNNANGNEASEAETEPEELKDSIPELNFEGREFKILNTTQSDLHYMNLMMEPYEYEDTGDIISDAAYRRSIEIQERFNCTIKEIPVSNGSRGSTFKKSASAGDNAYDIACITFGEALTAASDNSIFDINELQYVDLNAPWWDQNAKESVSILGKVFFCPGAYELSNFDMTRILMVNKGMLQDYNITEDVYGLVKDGKWTQAKFFEMAKQVSDDFNGDGKYNYQDIFGIASTADHVIFGSFMEGAGEMMVRKDENDVPYFAANSERFNSIFISMVDNFYSGNFYFYPKNVAGSEEWCTNMFNENRMLFYNITFNRIPKFRNMNADFGILPVPKYDESQDRYYCESGGGMVAVIPQSALEPDQNGAFLEAYAYYGYKYVIPEYKETSLKTKLSRDDDSSDMVDIIDVSRVYDLGRLYWASTAYDPYVTLFGNKKTEVSSLSEKNATRVAAAIEKSLAVFE